MFGVAVPTLNIAGEDRIRTHYGGCLSMLIFYVTFLFATLKLQIMFERKRPIIVTNVDQTAFVDGQEYKTDEEENFNFAVGVSNFMSGVKDDPRYFKWVASHYMQRKEETVRMNYELHPCTAEDLKNFYQPDSQTNEKL